MSARIQWHAHANTLGAPDQSVEELRIDVAVQEQSRPQRTRLTGGPKCAVRGHRHGPVDIGIGKHDVRRLSTALEGDAFEPVRGRAHDGLRGGVAAGERHLVHARMGDEVSTRIVPVTRDDVEDAVGKARLGEQLCELQCRHGGQFGWLEHHGVTHRERRPELPRVQTDRGIPRRDCGDDTDGLDARVRMSVVLVRHHRALDLVRCTGVVAEPLDRPLDFTDGVAQWFSVVHGLDSPEALGVPFEQIGQDVEQASPLGCGEPGPRAVQRGSGGIDCAVDIGLRRSRYPRPDVLGGRIDRIDAQARAGGCPSPADEQVWVIGNRCGRGHFTSSAILFVAASGERSTFFVSGPHRAPTRSSSPPITYSTTVVWSGSMNVARPRS